VPHSSPAFGLEWGSQSLRGKPSGVDPLTPLKPKSGLDGAPAMTSKERAFIGSQAEGPAFLDGYSLIREPFEPLTSGEASGHRAEMREVSRDHGPAGCQGLSRPAAGGDPLAGAQASGASLRFIGEPQE
jgi:hypothetical protein